MHGRTTYTLSFLCGISVGAAIGILMAPASGKETRRRLTEGAGREFLDRSRELVEMGKRFADEAASIEEEGRSLFRSTERTLPG